ncbi:MAG: sulfate/thiosulfate transport system permease protein, partial [Pseudonocardiales bacterium]|nr:sulfate/thiosulfate transport system permease protein [Pseudonocardiales bacterium]
MLTALTGTSGQRPGASAAAPAANRARPVRRRTGRSRWALRLVALAYVGVLVALPLGLVLWRTVDQGAAVFVDAVTGPEAIAAFRLTAIVAGSAIVINTVFGVGAALLLARYRFRGRRLLDLLIDVPISVSPIIVGLALFLAFGWTTGWFGPALQGAGLQVIFATPGMVLATAFVSLPLVVREVLPVLTETGLDEEQAARSLGANAVQRFRRITLPTIKWALAYGVVLSVARTLGEFGAVRVVSGNIGSQTQTVTLLVDERAEQFEPGAYQLSVVLIAVAALCIV